MQGLAPAQFYHLQPARRNEGQRENNGGDREKERGESSAFISDSVPWDIITLEKTSARILLNNTPASGRWWSKLLTASGRSWRQHVQQHTATTLRFWLHAPRCRMAFNINILNIGRFSQTKQFFLNPKDPAKWKDTSTTAWDKPDDDSSLRKYKQPEIVTKRWER